MESSHVASLASNIGMAYKQLQPFVKYADTKDRREILTSKLMSLANYATPLFLAKTQNTIKRLKLLMMCIIKWVYQGHTYIRIIRRSVMK